MNTWGNKQHHLAGYGCSRTRSSSSCTRRCDLLQPCPAERHKTETSTPVSCPVRNALSIQRSPLSALLRMPSCGTREQWNLPPPPFVTGPAVCVLFDRFGSSLKRGRQGTSRRRNSGKGKKRERERRRLASSDADGWNLVRHARTACALPVPTSPIPLSKPTLPSSPTLNPPSTIPANPITSLCLSLAQRQEVQNRPRQNLRYAICKIGIGQAVGTFG